MYRWILVLSLVIASAAHAADWTTPAEASHFRATPSYADTRAYLERLQQAAPDRIRLETFGATPQGRPFRLPRRPPTRSRPVARADRAPDGARRRLPPPGPFGAGERSGLSARPVGLGGQALRRPPDAARLRARASPATAGSVIVPLDQRVANVAIELLEPQASDSMLRSGYLDAIFEPKEYGEPRVL